MDKFNQVGNIPQLPKNTIRIAHIDESIVRGVLEKVFPICMEKLVCSLTEKMKNGGIRFSLGLYNKESEEFTQLLVIYTKSIDPKFDSTEGIIYEPKTLESDSPLDSNSDGYVYCSWCLEAISPQILDQNTLFRSTYKCSNPYCREIIVECIFCKNMARGGKNSNDSICLVHSGDIPNFDKLSVNLTDISNYKDIFERDSINVKRVIKIGFFILGGVSVIGPIAFQAAAAKTFFGSAIGYIQGSYLAGVSTNFITATGAALGGPYGGMLGYSYLGNIDGFDIVKVKEGVGHPVIFINCFLTQESEDLDSWKSQLGTLYPSNPWYCIEWESKRLLNLGTFLTNQIASAVGTQLAINIGGFLAKKMANAVATPGMILSVAGLVDNPWHIAMHKAEMTGLLLSDIFARTQDKKFILMGHSLGARVVFYALRNLASKDKKFIESVHLLGGAVGSENRNNDWTACKKSVQYNINNYYSSNDYVLKGMYQLGTLFASSPIGTNKITGISGIKNFDVSEFVSGHKEYKNNLSKFLVKS